MNKNFTLIVLIINVLIIVCLFITDIFLEIDLNLLIKMLLIAQTIILIYIWYKTRKDADQISKNIKVITGRSIDIESDNLDFDEVLSDLDKMSDSYRENKIKSKARKGQIRSILKSIQEGLIVVGKKEEVILCNDLLFQIYNLQDDIVNTKVKDLKFDTNLYELFETFKKEGHEFLEVVRKINDDFVLSYRISLIKEGKDNVTGHLILVSDITERYKLDAMRRTFISNITHELKTPLTSIMGYTETLKYIDIDQVATRNEFLDIIEEESNRLSRLINDILELHEIDEIKSIELVRVDLNKVIDNCVQLLIPQVDPAIDFIVDTKGSLFIQGDTEKLKQIVLNITSNALKYTNEGHVKLSSYVKGKTAYIVLEDTGIGINLKDQDAIFERFYRVDKSRSRKKGGTGLGLSIVKHLVKLHDGEIELNSVLNKGTTITVKLPIN